MRVRIVWGNLLDTPILVDPGTSKDISKPCHDITILVVQNGVDIVGSDSRGGELVREHGQVMSKYCTICSIPRRDNKVPWNEL